MHKIVLFFLIIIIGTNLLAQNFVPLLNSDKNETIFDATTLPNKKVAVLSFKKTDYFIFDDEKSHYEIFKDQLPSMDSTFTKLLILKRNGEVENELSIRSTQDSIFFYEQLKVFDDKIVLWGSVFTATAKTKTAVWLNFDLEIKSLVVYDHNLNFGDSFFIRSAYFFNINSNGNILCASKTGTLEIDQLGNLIKTYNSGFIQFPFVIDANENFIHPQPQFNQVIVYASKIDKGILIDENQNFGWDDIARDGFEFQLNKKKTAFYVNTLFRTGCSISSGTKPAIVKYNTNDFSSEIFYVDPTPNCISSRLGQFDIDLYQDNYIYFTNKAESCGFLTPFIATNICEAEYINLYCLDEAGNLRWSKYLGGDALYNLNGVIATADEGCLVFVSRYKHGVNQQYETDSYYLKFDKYGNAVEPLSTSILESEAGGYNIQLYPNPVSEVVYIDISHSINQNL